MKTCPLAFDLPHPASHCTSQHCKVSGKPSRIHRHGLAKVKFSQSTGLDRLLKADRELLDDRERPHWKVDAHQTYLARSRWRLGCSDDSKLSWKAVLVLFKGPADPSDISFASIKLLALRQDTGLLHIAELPGPGLCPYEGARWLGRLSAESLSIWHEAILEILEDGIPGTCAQSPSTIRRGLFVGNPESTSLAEETARGSYHHLFELLGERDEPLAALLARDTQLIRVGLGRFRNLGISDDLLARIARTGATVSPNLYNWVREVSGDEREQRLRMLERFPLQVQRHAKAGHEVSLATILQSL